jgi:hypothetical protein
MRSWLTSLVLLASVLPARADSADATARAGERHLRVAGDLELGLMTSRARGSRRDFVPLFALHADLYWVLSPRWAVSVGAGIPVPPGLSAQVTLGVTWRPLGGPTGLGVRGGPRAVYAFVDLCAGEPELCPMEQALDEPRDGGGWVYGGVAEAGVFYDWVAWSRVLLRVGVSYVGGWFEGRRKNAELPIEGLYQGGVFWFGVSSL